ncbi:aldehyde dehydrogenase [Rhodobacter sp. 24-YEA-8]|uniref:aldehyde dehydrogenase n=1 Tax=Rhodobacter sp. 24-YEA-8 TaxID=1884310 RepID=UPI0008946A92|nr:aldehyde dehydrogenase [Rhodobacter sp. 24-YEA-8]SED74381.1 gamma-glutamyl-gamma-aminobutyraldehyde dehydrogenase [Rhodobacter sp. 24-YEA-8]
MTTSLDKAQWQALAAQLSPEGRCFIDGAYVDAASGATLETVNPATGKVLGLLADGGVEDIDRAVRAARRAFDSGVWSGMSPSDRGRRLIRFAELVEEHAQELALLETLDVGKPISDSLAIDLPLSITCLRWYGEAVDKIYDEIAPTPGTAVAMMRRAPLGVVAAVVPWNFPLMMACWKIAPILAAGNTVVLKPAEQSSLTAIRIAALAVEAGLPPGVLNVVPGRGEIAGRALGLHMDVDCIAFTGSTEVGKYFMQYSGQSNLKRVGLECGGKSPNIIFADAPDIRAAAVAAAWGLFYNQGEVCNAGSRVLVEESVREEVVETIIETGRAMRQGDPLDPATQIGAMVDQGQANRVMDYIAIGQQEGARLASGGKRHEEGACFIEPTVFDGVRNDMRIAREEIFGPVLSVLPFRDEAEAVSIANDTIYGLAAGLWTRDLNRSFRVSQKLQAGVVWVNCFDHGHISSPFGGFKQSGFGRDKSLHALDKYSDIRTTWINLG